MMASSQPASSASDAMPVPESASATTTVQAGEENRSFNKFNFINIIAYLLNVFVTFSIGTFGLAGRPTNAELSEKYQTIVTPAGIAFSIWGPIFILQAFWVLWQLLPSQRNNSGVTLVGWKHLFLALFQCGWTLSFSYEIMWLSLVCMYGILFFLVWIVVTLNRNYTDKIWKGYLLWQLPFSMHCGWIMAASAVNTNVLAVFYDASANVQLGVASASLVVLAAVALTWLSSYPVDLAIPAVLVWALAGVYLALEEPADLLLETFSASQIDGIQLGVVISFFLILVALVGKCLYVCCVQRPRALQAAAGTPGSSTLKTQAKEQDNKSEGTDEENPALATPY